MKPILVDLFCKAGGATKGFQRAGFFVIGVDIDPQPRYVGDAFVQMDALEALRVLLAGEKLAGYGMETIAAFAASPPCQRYSRETPTAYKSNHPDLIEPVRTLLRKTGQPYVIENVADARMELIDPLMLCGTMFGLKLWRHRWFEIDPVLPVLTPSCQHHIEPVVVTGTSFRKGIKRDAWKWEKNMAMQIDWMITDELDEAIPPAYTEWIGRQLLATFALTSAPYTSPCSDGLRAELHAGGEIV